MTDEPESGSLGSFGRLKLNSPFWVRMVRKIEEPEFLELNRLGFAVNEDVFRGYTPGLLLLNEIAWLVNKSLDAKLTPLPVAPGDHIRRINFTEMFGG